MNDNFISIDVVVVDVDAVEMIFKCLFIGGSGGGGALKPKAGSGLGRHRFEVRITGPKWAKFVPS